MSKSREKPSRRNFLFAVGAAVGAGGAAAGMAAMAIRPGAIKTAEAERKERGGYQETAHVRSYYNTAKV